MHAAPVLVPVSHLMPQPPQFVTVLVGVSQPSVSGEVVLQSAKPVLQLVYVHFDPPLHAAPLLFVVSHALPQPPHELASKGVSQPSSASGAAGVVQLAKPGLHVEAQTPPEPQTSVATLVPAQARPQAPQSVVVSIFVSHPFVSGAVVLQLP